MSWRASALPLLLLLTSTTATAQMREVAPGDFRCDAPAGYYYNQEIPALQPEKPVTVRFRLLTEHPDPTWQEQAAVYFETPDGRMRVQVGKADDDQQHMFVVTERDDTGDTDVVDQFPITNEWITVSLTLGDSGVVRVESRGQEAKLDLGTTLAIPTKVHCHSGAFEIQLIPPPVASPPRATAAQ
jgi:hypothetical protein